MANVVPLATRLQVLPPKTGTAFRLPRSSLLRVTDLEGEQVADLAAFNFSDRAERLSSGRTIDYANSIYLTSGNVLYSNRSRPMFRILADDVGRHDFILTPCSRETFQLLYGKREHSTGCFENLRRSLSRFGIRPDDIPTTFNIFMNVNVETNGALMIKPPRSRAGDSIVLRAEMDLIVGLTACAAELTNNFKFKPIGYEIFSDTDERSARLP